MDRFSAAGGYSCRMSIDLVPLRTAFETDEYRRSLVSEDGDAVIKDSLVVVRKWGLTRHLPRYSTYVWIVSLVVRIFNGFLSALE